MKFRSLTSDIQVMKLEIQNNSEFQIILNLSLKQQIGYQILTKSVIWVPGNLKIQEQTFQMLKIEDDKHMHDTHDPLTKM